MEKKIYLFFTDEGEKRGKVGYVAQMKNSIFVVLPIFGVHIPRKHEHLLDKTYKLPQK